MEYNFVSDLPEDYVCQICMKLLNEPQLTDCCGQHFCRTCLDRWFQRQGKKQCPHCRNENFTHILYLPLKRKMNELKAYCSNREKGCGLTLKLVELERHLSTDNPNGCGYEEIECPNECRLSLLRKDMENHCENKCPEREVKCKYCNVPGPHCFITGTGWVGHIPYCKEYPIDCQNKCGAKGLKRKDLNKHREVCPLEPVECPNKCFRLLWLPILRKDIEDHCKNNCPEREVTCKYCNEVGPLSYIISTEDWHGHVKQCQEYPVDCPNKCSIKKIKRKDIEKHKKEICPLEPVECPNKCNCHLRWLSILRKDMEDHRKNKCPEREVRCEYCNEVGSYFYIASTSWNSGHVPRCLEYPVDCPNKCTVKGLKRKDVTKHKEECPLEPVECPFYPAGCTLQMMVRKDLDDHMKSNTQQHLLHLMTSHTKLLLAHEKLLNDYKELKLSEQSLRSNVANKGFKMRKEGNQLTYRIPYINYKSKSWVSPQFAVHAGTNSMKHTLYLEEKDLRTLSLMSLKDEHNACFEIEVDCTCDKRNDKPFEEDSEKPPAEALYKTNTVFKICAKCNEFKKLGNESIHTVGQEIGTHHLPHGFAQAYYEFCIVTLTPKKHSCN